MIERLEEIFGDCLDSDLGAEPEGEEAKWVDKVRHSVAMLGIHAWDEHMVAAGCNEGRSVKDCSRTVRKVIEEVI